MEPRIGDREREEASARLAEHYALGRLDEEEHAERLDAVWSARTGGDLRQIFEDLPRLTARPSVPAPAPGRARDRRSRRRVRPPLLAIALGVLLLVAVTPVPWWAVLVGVLVLAKVSGAWGAGAPCHRPMHPSR